MKMQAQMMQDMANGIQPGEQEPQPNANAPTPIEPAGKGISQGLKNNVWGDAITPGSRK